MSAPGFLNQIWQITRKEIKECINSKRFIIFLLIFGATYLITTGLLSGDVLGGSLPPADTLTYAYVLSSIFLWIIPIAFTYDAISKERQSKSLDIVLSKPVMKYELVLGKFLGAGITLVAIVGIVHLAGYALSIGLSGIIPPLSQFGDFGAYLGIIFLGMICYAALALLFSIITRSGATSLIITIIIILFILPLLPAIFSLVPDLPSWVHDVIYAISPANCMAIVSEFLRPMTWDIEGEPINFLPISRLSVWESILAMFIFIGTCLSLAIAIFQKKDLK